MSEILLEELPAARGRIGRVTLNVEATLNSLTLNMVDRLQEQLDAWAADQDIVAVWIDGAGDKAFCAGGDVQALHASSTGTPGGPCEYAENFFTREYRMNHTLHTFAKPVVCWGHGIVMGGGLGIMAACSHRVVTETTRIAMPEVTIALFPDVGGSWFLNRMPGRCGEFLALTGASINAADAIYTGIADCCVAGDQKRAALDALLAAEWSGDADTDHGIANRVLHDVAGRGGDVMPAGQVESHREIIDALCQGGIHEIIDNITSQTFRKESDSRWLGKARDGLAHGSSLAARWTHHQLRLTRHASLREVFQSEIVLATNIMRHPEFGEGVRALLIDKDRNPSWTYPSSREVPDEVVEGFFVPPWPDNPLADL